MSDGEDRARGPSPGVKPGALTDLLRQVAASPDEVPPVLPGAIIGRFEILRELGRGAFGVVYEARDRDLGRQVALKMVRPGAAAMEEGKVVREAEAIARLAHPNLVTLHDVGRSDGRPYLVFEFLRGKTLQERLDDGPLPIHEAVHIATEVARGLSHAHAEGVIHRDLKPANVFVTDKGQVKILDFGMAHAFGRRRLSGGTPAYMAPEQWEDDPEDERTDVFALGVMLYRLLTGEYPFPEGQGRWSAEPATVRRLDVPGAADLAELVERMLDRMPKGRPRDGAAVLAALAPIEERLRGSADGSPPVQAKRRRATFGDLLSELRRRRVFRAMVGYGIFAFAMLQVAEPLMHGLHLPDWVLSAVIAALALGFPVALALAWLYDLTSAGVRRTRSIAGPDRASISLGPKAALLLAAALLAVIPSAGWYLWKRSAGGQEAARATLAAGDEGRIPVAVADFQNGTTDPELNGLSGMLITSLEQSRRLLVLTRSRLADLIRQAGREVPERLDETLAREVGRKAGVKALLIATVHRFDDLYAIEMRALDPARDEYLFTLQEEGRGKSSVPGMIDRLSRRTREWLRERPADLESARRQVAEVTTGDLGAYEHFFKARQALDLRQFERAREELQAALRVDPSFALAHYQTAVLDAWTVRPGFSGEASIRTAREHLDTAVRLSDRLPEKERLGLLAWKATWDEHLDEARRLRDQAAEAYPQDKEAVFWAGDIRFHVGDTVAAVPYFERALQLDPEYRLVQEHLVLALAQVDRRQDQLAWARRWAESARDPASLRALGRALLANDRRDEAEAVLRQATAIDGRFRTSPALASYLMQNGKAHEAEALLRRAVEVLPKAAPADDLARLEQVSTAESLVAALAHQGRWREARQVAGRLETMGLTPSEAAGARLGLESGLAFAGEARSAEGVRAAVQELEKLGGLQKAPARLDVAIDFALAGEVAAAERHAQAALASPHATEIQPTQRSAFEALVAWRTGRLDEAAERARALAESPYVDLRYKALHVLGEIELARGRDADAAEALEQARALGWSPRLGDRCYLQAKGLRLLAVAYDRLGDRAKARERVAETLRQWQRADADLPGLAEAKALRMKLAAGVGAR